MNVWIVKRKEDGEYPTPLVVLYDQEEAIKAAALEIGKHILAEVDLSEYSSDSTIHEVARLLQEGKWESAVHTWNRQEYPEFLLEEVEIRETPQEFDVNEIDVSVSCDEEEAEGEK
jgi:hypothetical protein